MGSMIELRDVCFTYAGNGATGGLRNVTLRVQPGEVVLLCGASGCGKTTVTRLINGLIPHFYEGTLTGETIVAGQDMSKIALHDTAKWVGSVFQNPRSQFFCVETTGEMAFCAENLGIDEYEILRRIQDTTAEMHMESLLGRNMFHLSGGEKQRIACASVSVAQPDVIVLDEPSSNLDMRAIADLREQIVRWKRQGKTIVVAEHRLHYLEDVADRVIYMQGGQIVAEYTPTQLMQMKEEERERLGLRIASIKSLHGNAVMPAATSQEDAITLEDFCFAYPHGEQCICFSGASFPRNAIVALVGHNGAGKSTLARCVCGLEKKCKGMLRTGDKALGRKDRMKSTFMVMQDVNHQLFTESVLDEVLLSMDTEDVHAAEEILTTLNLIDQKNSHPMALSGGQKQRVAIACAVAAKSPYLLLDEPTSGLDLLHMKKVAALLADMQQSGCTLIVVTHDPEFVLRCCTHVVQMELGMHMASYALDGAGRERLVQFFDVG